MFCDVCAFGAGRRFVFPARKLRAVLRTATLNGLRQTGEKHMFKTFALILVGFGCVLNLSAQINGCANSAVINNLGAAGPGNFTVFSMGGAGSLLNINLATITGS